MLLGPKRGPAAVGAYLAEGAAGLPVFAGGAGSLVYMAGPTGGYLVGFLPAVWVVGVLARRGWDRRLLSAAAAMGLGTAVIFACGLAWLWAWMGFAPVEALLTAGLIPFLPGAAVKIVAAAVALPLLWKLMPKGG